MGVPGEVLGLAFELQVLHLIVGFDDVIFVTDWSFQLVEQPEQELHGCHSDCSFHCQWWCWVSSFGMAPAQSKGVWLHCWLWSHQDQIFISILSQHAVLVKLKDTKMIHSPFLSSG